MSTVIENPEHGDQLTVVVVYPNADRDREPVAKVGGRTAYIRFPKDCDYQPSFAEEIDVKVADVEDRHLLVLPTNVQQYREDGQ